jgi:hypothetical protein
VTAVAVPALAVNTMSTMGKGTDTYTVAAQNGSGETGTVVLRPDGDKTTVMLQHDGAPSAAQPAHVHTGSCAKLDPKPAYPLNLVINGTSTTTLDVPLAKLTSGAYAINVHKSTNELATYVACADLRPGNMPGMGRNAAPQPAATPTGY